MKTSTIILILLFSTSCGKPSKLRFEAPLEINTRDASETEKVDFAQVSKKILQPKCLECHKRFSDEERLKRFITPGDAENSVLYQVVKDGSMPQNAPVLDTAEVEMIRNYILNLKKN